MTRPSRWLFADGLSYPGRPVLLFTQNVFTAVKSPSDLNDGNLCLEHGSSHSFLIDFTMLNMQFIVGFFCSRIGHVSCNDFRWNWIGQQTIDMCWRAVRLNSNNLESQKTNFTLVIPFLLLDPVYFKVIKIKVKCFASKSNHTDYGRKKRYGWWTQCLLTLAIKLINNCPLPVYI